MKVLVTGCNGKLGTAVCELLLAGGHVVVGIDAAAAPDRPHKVIVDTLLNPYTVHRAIDALGGVDAVVHLANHVNSMVAPAEVVLRENMAMNSSVFIAAHQAGASRLVFASSIQAMMGGAEPDGSPSQKPPARIPVDESYPSSPSNVYGLSKVLTEQMLGALTSREQFGRECSAFSVRIPFILLPKWFDASVTRTGQAEFMWGGSECFAYIERTDAADAFVRAVETPSTGHQIVWCAAPDLRSPEPVASVIDRFYASTPGADEARRRNSLQNCDKALALLGWRATRVLREERARRGIAPPAGV